MIRIRDISLPPSHTPQQLVQAAARQLRIRETQIKQLDVRRRSVDARKKHDVRIIYTVDVLVKEREDKVLKMAHCAKASVAADYVYSVPQPQRQPSVVSTTIWPISAPASLAPAKSFPSRMMPPPMPVPRVTTMAERQPRAAPA